MNLRVSQTTALPWAVILSALTLIGTLITGWFDLRQKTALIDARLDALDKRYESRLDDFDKRYEPGIKEILDRVRWLEQQERRRNGNPR